MTQEEIEKKAYEIYPVDMGWWFDHTGYAEKTDLNAERREGYIKALTEVNSLPKIKGWVARDSVEDGFIGTGLILHHSKPSRCGGEWSSQTIAMHLPWEMFPDLKWKDDPIEVELLIKKV